MGERKMIIPRRIMDLHSIISASALEINMLNLIGFQSPAAALNHAFLIDQVNDLFLFGACP